MRGLPFVQAALLAAISMVRPVAAGQNTNDIVTCTQPNLFLNPSFDSGTSQWTTTGSSSTEQLPAGTGGKNVKIGGSKSEWTLQQSVNLENKKQYTISIDRNIWLKSGQSPKSCSFYMYVGDKSKPANRFGAIAQDSYAIGGKANTWTTWTATYTATNSGNNVIGFYGTCTTTTGDSSSATYLDNASIQLAEPCCEQNAVQDYSFEGSISKWTFTGGNSRTISISEYTDGSKSLMVPNDNSITLKQSVSLGSTAAQVFSIDYQVFVNPTSTGTRYCTLSVTQQGATGSAATIVTDAATYKKTNIPGWKTLKTGFTPRASTITLSITMTCSSSGSASSTMYFDNVRIMLDATCPAPATTTLPTLPSTTSSSDVSSTVVSTSSSDVSSTVVSTSSSDVSSTVASTSSDVSSTPSSTAASTAASSDVSSTAASTPASSDVSSTAASTPASSDVSSTAASTPASSDVSSTAASTPASSDVSSTAASTPSSTDISSDVSSTVASTPDSSDVSSTAAATPAASDVSSTPVSSDVSSTVTPTPSSTDISSDVSSTIDSTTTPSDVTTPISTPDSVSATVSSDQPSGTPISTTPDASTTPLASTPSVPVSTPTTLSTVTTPASSGTSSVSVSDSTTPTPTDLSSVPTPTPSRKPCRSRRRRRSVPVSELEI